MNKIIDTHLHCWDTNKLDYYWLKNDTSILAKNYFLEDIIPQFESAGVSGAILVQATNSLAESDWFLELASLHSSILGAVVWLPLTDPKATNQAINKYTENIYFKGVRHQIHDEQDAKWLLQPTVLESLKLLAQNNIPFDLVGTKTTHIETVLSLSEKIPNLKMVFDHLNQPPLSNKNNWKHWAHLMGQAAQFPNLYAKISGLGTTTGKPFGWTAEDIKPAIDFAIAHFGTNRMFCGSDWPVCLLAGEYSYTWKQYQTALQSLLTIPQQETVFYQNAKNFYRIN